MSNENQPEVEVKVETVAQNTTVEPTIEDQAKEMGWNPEYDGPNKKSAEQFVRDGSFFRKIDAQNKKIDALLSKIESQHKIVQQMEEHSAKVAEANYRKGIQDALAKRTQAVEIGDVEGFHKAELELKELEAAKPAFKQTQTQPNNVVTQEMLDWVEENKGWFNQTNARMVKEADYLFTVEAQENPNKSQTEVLALVKDKMMKLYPDKFENPNKSKPIAVTKSSYTSASSGKSSLAHRLTDTQKAFYEQAKGMGVKMSIDDYARQLDITGDLKNE